MSTEASFSVMKESWMKEASCKDAPVEYFILDSSQSTRKGARFCAVCPVVAECESYAISTKSVGIWGGKLFTNSGPPTQLDLSGHYDDMRPIVVDLPPPGTLVALPHELMPPIIEMPSNKPISLEKRNHA